jgi:hypothetical protein
MRRSAHRRSIRLTATLAAWLALLVSRLAEPARLMGQEPEGSTSTLQGRVLAPDSTPIAGAVVLLDSTWQTHTDDGGAFRLASLPPGRHHLRVRALGYAPFVGGLELRAGVAQAVVTLAAAPYLLPELAVTARNQRLERTGYYRRQREEHAARFLETDTLLRLDSLNLLRALGRLPRVRLDWGALDPRLTSIECRKGFALWVNGVLVDSAEQAFFLRVIRPADVDAMEIYERSTPPLIFHRGELGGGSRKERAPGCVVAIWERGG